MKAVLINGMWQVEMPDGRYLHFCSDDKRLVDAYIEYAQARKPVAPTNDMAVKHGISWSK